MSADKQDVQWLRDALEGMLVLHEEFCRKASHAALVLDPDLIKRMNEAPRQARLALEATK